MQDVLELIRDMAASAGNSDRFDQFDVVLVNKSAFEALVDHAKQEKYVASYGEKCPHCGGDMKAVGDPIFGVGGICWRESQCSECNRIVNDTYCLVGYSDIDPHIVASKE